MVYVGNNQVTLKNRQGGNNDERWPTQQIRAHTANVETGN
jgi:hypothetical protein